MPSRRPRLAPGAGDGLSDSLAALAEELELPTGYPDEAVAEAAAAARDIPTDPDAAGLPDLRDIPFLTIDPDGSEDLDQALHLERTAEGAILHYAIADVPSYVEAGGAIDAEARRRGQTLYGADRRVPLHPPVLSTDAASLLPEQSRRAYVWRFVLDDGARPVETTLTRAIVQSRRQWSYADAQRAVDAGDPPEGMQDLAWFGAQRAERERERAGASLNIPEVEIVPEGDRYRLERRANLPIEEWNAQVSLLTGMAAADIMLRGRIGILRTLPPADEEDVATFRAQTVALGLPWPTDQPYGEYLHTLDNTDPRALAVREAAAVLFRGAGYAAFDGTPPEQAEQAAVGAPYAHTTAPLRRLVDRWSLVVCDALANGHEVPRWARDSLADLPEIMARTSALASRFESGAVNRVEAALLRPRIGETLDAVVLRIHEGRARVQVDDPILTATCDVPPSVTSGQEIHVQVVSADVASGSTRLAFVPPGD